MSTKLIAEKLLVTMSRNSIPESFEATNPPRLHDERPWIPWTPETLMGVLQSWDPTISLLKLTEVLDVLEASGLIIRRDAPLNYYELTNSGRAEAERLGSSHLEP
jgi:hypothetical protein